MLPSSSLSAVALGLALASFGCAQDEHARATMAELNTLTDELVEIVAGEKDTSAAVERAQQELDANTPGLGPQMAWLMGLRLVQLAEETRTQLQSDLADNVSKMALLQGDLGMATARDPELAAAVSKLVDDHRELMSGGR